MLRKNKEVAEAAGTGGKTRREEVKPGGLAGDFVERNCTEWSGLSGSWLLRGSILCVTYCEPGTVHKVQLGRQAHTVILYLQLDFCSSTEVGAAIFGAH